MAHSGTDMRGCVVPFAGLASHWERSVAGPAVYVHRRRGQGPAGLGGASRPPCRFGPESERLARNGLRSVLDDRLTH